jgi:DNA primase
MAKVSPVSIKYLIHANMIADGALEKPDVIGALFGQTEGLLGSELEMRDLQKEGKIGRIEVDLETKERKTYAKIKIPTALDQSETTLIGAAIETIDRVGPSDAQITVEKIEDVRGSKRDYIIERAKALMKQVHGSANSKEISNEIKDSAKISGIEEYGNSKLAFGGDLSGEEIVVVEGRADVVNLARAGIKNVVGMNGTKLPEEIKELSKDKIITLFIDGDRGGKLIAKNAYDNAKISFVAVAPDGKEVEELTEKEILICLRKRISAEEFLRDNNRRNFYAENETKKDFESDERKKFRLKEIFEKNRGSEKAIILDSDLKEIREVPIKSLNSFLERNREKTKILIIDGNVTKQIISSSEESHVQLIVAKNFTTTDTNIKLLSF